jgi:myosin heavy subunit
MVTEVLGLMIAVGAILVFGVRYLNNRQAQAQELQEDMQQSTRRLKAELERSGDAVVKRLGSHVAHLENLIREADARNAELARSLSESHRMEEDFRRQLKDMERNLEDVRAENRRLSEARENQLRQEEELSRQRQAMQQQQEAERQAASAPQRIDALDFAQVLQNSIQRGAAEEAAASAQSLIGEPHQEVPQEGQPLVNAQQAAGLAEAMTNWEPAPEELFKEPDKVEAASTRPHPGPTPDTAAAKARAMLLSGYSIEEVSRDTGLGKRAVELVREMSRHELEKVQ